MKIGIMGGTLDPVHVGHIQIAQAVRKTYPLDEIWLLPDGTPPHKSRITPASDRLEMTRLAAEDEARMRVCDIEVNRVGTTYTVDTLTELRTLYSEHEFIYIIGADTLKILDSWRKFPEIAKKCAFAAVGRPGSTDITEKLTFLREQYGAVIRLMDIEGPDISSSDIRRRVSKGESIRGLVPESVENYILSHGLYLTSMTEEAIEEILKKKLTLHRFRHTLGVREVAEQLARKYGVSPAKARLAALLHDCAKSLPYPEMAQRVRAEIADADEEEIEMEAVIHAPAGMLVARDEFGVRDEEILQAIRRHTLGDAHMTKLDKIIYVADFIEPNRRPFPGLDDARRLSEIDLDAAVRRCAELSSEFILLHGKHIHPRTAALLSRDK